MDREAQRTVISYDKFFPTGMDVVIRYVRAGVYSEIDCKSGMVATEVKQLSSRVSM